MKFLIAGLGSIGRRHLRNLAALGETDIVLFRTGRSTLPDEELAPYVSEQSLEEALAHKPDAVIVSNPTALHLDVAIPAAEAGCHLLIEKPISHSMDRVRDLQEAVRTGGGKVLVGYQFRFHPGIQGVKHALEESRIGDPLYARAYWGEYLPDWHPWEDYQNSYAARSELGGGVTLTLSHPFDYLRFFFGEVRTVVGWAERLEGLHIDVDGMAEATMLMHSGVHASVHVNYLDRPPRHQLEILGTQGRLVWLSESGRVILEGRDGDRTTIFEPGGAFERNQLFLSEMKHFLAMIWDELPPVCTLDDGIEALRIALTLIKADG